MTKVGGRFGTALVGFLILLAFGELVLRVFDYGPGHAPLNADPVLHHVHPKDYRYLAYSKTGEYGGFNVYFDKDGLRAATPEMRAAKEKPADCRVAFMGDSFTEGVQVPYEDTFAGLLAGVTRCEVKNYGVSSYSPIFYGIQWRDAVRRTSPSLVVLQLYGNDVWTDEEFMGRAKRDAAGIPVALPEPPGYAAVEFLRHIYLGRLVRMVQQRVWWWLEDNGADSGPAYPQREPNPDISELSSGLVQQLARDVAQSGATFVLFAVPSTRGLPISGAKVAEVDFSDKWKAWAEKAGVEFVDMRAAFAREAQGGRSPFFERDVHFNAIGHALVARTLCGELSAFLVVGDCSVLGSSNAD
jgi:lysophospholipase L1-like esterase